uniref:Uncharacterized protein n=1 Tax=Sparus aurata TaxID=8175 RepID=A0A671V2H6_SPAAU
ESRGGRYIAETGTGSIDSREQTGTLISPGDIHSSLRTSVDTVKHEAASTFSCDQQQHPLSQSESSFHIQTDTRQWYKLVELPVI